MIQFKTHGQVVAYMAALRRLRYEAMGRAPRQRAALIVEVAEQLRHARVPVNEALPVILKYIEEQADVSAAEDAGIAVMAAMEAGLIQVRDVNAMPPKEVVELYAEIVSAFERAYKDPKN